jgi:RHS repeat-associated protein
LRTLQDGAGPLYTFGYDAFGKRVTKTRAPTQRAVYVGDLYEQRAINGGINESVFRLQTDEGIVGEIAKSWSNGSVTRRMFHTDHQGSPQAQTIGTVSTLTGGFSPFGGRMGPAPAQMLSNYGYTGHIADYDIALINMKGRIYDPQLRRFLTRDAVLDNPRLIGGRSPYAYVRNNPTNLADPTGLMSMEDPSLKIDGDKGQSASYAGWRGMSPSQLASIQASQAAAAGAREKQKYLDKLSASERREWEHQSKKQSAKQGLEMQLGYWAYDDLVAKWLNASTLVADVVLSALDGGWKFEFGYNGPGIAGMTFENKKTIRLSGVGGDTFGHELGHFLHVTYLKSLEPGGQKPEFLLGPAMLNAKIEWQEGFAEMVAIGLGLKQPTDLYNSLQYSGQSLVGAAQSMGREKIEAARTQYAGRGYDSELRHLMNSFRHN